jgi:dGTPase
MFDRLNADLAQLPMNFTVIADSEGLSRAAADYLSGMTDRFALEEYDRLHGASR